MQLTTIKKGSRGPLVRLWQNYLRGLGHYLGVTDGQFGAKTEEATKKFQTVVALFPDGVVGNYTWGKAMSLGLELVEDTGKGRNSPNWPPVPKGLVPASLATRHKLFGKFDFQPAPTANNPEGIKILGNWQSENLIRVTVPQLKGIVGAPKDGRIFWHKAAKEQLLRLFQAWADAGLMHLVRSWAGSWNPRFVRGSRTNLSNHAWAVALDINAPWNGLGRQPALVGEHGSVRELVPLANEHGFYWGGHYDRKDGMHFEVSSLVHYDD